MNDTSSMIERAEQLFGEGQTEQARDLLIHALEIDPMLHAAHNDLGVILTHEGRLNEALNHYEKAIELAPDELTYQKNLADFFIMQMNDKNSALRIYLEILRNAPDDLEAILHIGHLCAAGGDFFSARKFYWKALELDPENSGASCGLQDIYQRESEINPKHCRVQIISPSDLDQDPDRRKLWGDYWLKHDLAAELEQHGMAVVENDPDVIIAFIGVPLKELPKNAYKIAWVYSHPDMITSASLRQYDKIFCMSPLFIPKLEAMGYRDIEFLIGATSKQPLDRRIEYDIVFVGNSRGIKGRQIVTDIGETPYNFKVWGNDWDNMLPEKYFAGRYFANEKLHELYASALISITDHHPDMAREGFLSNKIFDILASGGFAISDENACIQEIFGDTVPQYQSPEHLRELFDLFINNPEKRSSLMARGREIALRYNFKALAERLIAAIHPYRASNTHAKRLKPTVAYIDLFNPDNSNFHWLRAFKAYGHTVPFDIREIYFKGLGKIAEEIITLKPDHLHLGGSVKDNMVPPTILDYIKKQTGCRVSSFYGDARPSVYHEELGNVADGIYISNRSHVKQGEARGLSTYHYLPCPTDPELFHPHDLVRIHEIAFIGNNNNSSRLTLLHRLNTRFDLVVAGKDWQTSGLNYQDSVFGPDFAALCSRSKILLGLMGDEWTSLEAYFSNRLANTMACGAFLIQRYTPGLETVFENHRHLVWYETEQDLLDQIEYYLAHDREREDIANAGRMEVINRYNYSKSVEMILKSSGTLKS